MPTRRLCSTYLFTQIAGISTVSIETIADTSTFPILYYNIFDEFTTFTRTPQNPAMDELPRKLCVMHAFRPYLRLLGAFNAENFPVRQQSSRLRAYDASAIAISMLLLLIATLLSFLKIVDEHFRMVVFTTTFPIFISMIQVISTFFVLTSKNRMVTATIERLQAIIGNRKIS